MIGEKLYSLTAAAKEIGVRRQTLKKWLVDDLGIVIPRVRRGSKVLIRERDLTKIIERRRSAVGSAA